MDVNLFKEIVLKATSTYVVPSVHLYNWGEPFLHPELPRLVKIVRECGPECYISTNLNVVKNAREVLNACPNTIRISLSGFRQAAYGITHRGGDIELVKNNMRHLSETARTMAASTAIHVFYHRYMTNLDDELPMRHFAKELKMGFHPVWALLMPVEKVMDYIAQLQGEESALSDKDMEIVDSLALPLKEALQAAQFLRHKPCPFRDGSIIINSDGDVQLCCAVYDSRRFGLGPFLQSEPDQLQKLKCEHKYCGLCMQNGVHIYESFGSFAFDLLAAQKIGPRYANRMFMRAERFKKRIFHAVPDKVKQVLFNLYTRATQW